MVTRSEQLATIGLSLADLVLEVFCFAASPSFKGVATLVATARQAVNDVGTSSPEFVKDRSMLSKRVIEVLTKKVKAAREHCLDRGIDASLLAQAESAVAALISTDAEEDLVVLSAVRDPEGFEKFFTTRAAKHRQQIEEQSEPYFDALVQAVAATYVEIAPWSDSFVVSALRSMLDECTGVKEQMTIHHMEDRQLFDQILQLLQSLAKAIEELRKPSHTERVRFGSRPIVVKDRFCEREEQKQLDPALDDDTSERTVLVGMRGCGKTQLAASLAEQCEGANWKLVAWINAVSPDTIQSDLVELAQRLDIDTSDQPAQDVIVRRCLDHLKSAAPTDRLIVFDNVEDINHLTGLVPRGDGLRVIATTTNKVGWEDQGWNSIKFGVFDRNTSIEYLLTVTKSDDHDAADALAERLGDLPLAIAQAAATARNKDLSLARYLKRLESHRKEHAIRPVPGDEYTDDVATVLWMAVEAAVDGLKDGSKEIARRQLGALALLAESGVPTRWLDPTSAQGGDEDSQSAEHSTDEEAHDALTELINRSIVQQTADDGTMTMLHRLQAQVLRECWSESEYHEACAAASDLLGHVDFRRYHSNDTKARRQEALDLVDQLRSIGTQEHSQVLFKSPQVSEALFQAFSHACDLGLPYEALTLDVAVDALEGLLGPDHPATLTSRNNLAYAYHAAGRLTEAITLYEQVLTDTTRVLGEDHPATLTSRNNLAGAYESAGRLTEAIALYEQVLPDSIRVLGEDHPATLTSRNNLAGAYESAGRLTEAIALYEQVLPDSIRVLGEDHPATLTSRNNLAGAYESAGRLTEAIALYEQVLTDRIRVLGEDHPHTLTSRNNLAGAYREAGRLTEAIALYEQVLTDHTRVLGEDHPDTLASRHNLAYAYHTAGRLTEAITLYKLVLADRIRILGEDHPQTIASYNNLANAYETAGRTDENIALFEQILSVRMRVFGEDHPDTLTSRNNLAYAYHAAGRLTEAITLYEQVLPDRIRVLGEDHPDTLTSRNNLAYAYESAGRLTEAIIRWQAVCADCLRILGPDHPLTATVRKNLEAARRELAQQEDGSRTVEQGTQN